MVGPSAEIGRRRWARHITMIGACFASAACDSGSTGPDGEGTLEIVADGLDAPLYVTAAPHDTERLFVVEKTGRVRIVRDGEVLPDPYLDLASQVSDDGEQGLLGLAFHPEYEDNGYVFVNFTNPQGDTRVVRFTASASPDAVDPASASTVLEVEQPFTNHNGGQLAFGPDGMLYVALGDGGSAGDPSGNGQDVTTLLGAILRIDVDQGAPYAIPSDNPFVGVEDAAEEVWMYGLRNPWRFSFDSANGDLWIGDVGQDDVEEVSVVRADEQPGANLGWNILEGTRCFDETSCNPSRTVLPVYDYTHDDGCSVTGGYVYRGPTEPSLQGRYFFGDFCGGWIRSLRMSGGGDIDVLDHTDEFGSVPSLTSFGVDAAGELYAVSMAGTVYRVVAP